MRSAWPTRAGGPGPWVPGTFCPGHSLPLHIRFLFARNQFANSPESVKVFVFLRGLVIPP